MQPYDVIVIGKGNAVPCAALAAGGRGVTVAMMKAATPDESGSRLAGGVMRLAYDNAVAPRKPITDLERRNTDRESHARAPFLTTSIESPPSVPIHGCPKLPCGDGPHLRHDVRPHRRQRCREAGRRIVAHAT